ncbi:5-formyltetrahydrofolate cyclo-ligase [Candidatus Peregrinibacteria bacterium CG2_30_44_17]|nr:MAG: 5-formyltetrahydrofolate cyclo-ligase [Candidatus Peregrinibacteria bacterium CG2_30_44_17]
MPQKTRIRTEIKQKRQSLGRLRKSILDRKIRAQIERYEPFLSARTVLLYASMNDEIDTLKLIKKHHATKRILLPTVCTDTSSLKLYELTDMTSLKAGYQGILEIPHCEATERTHEDIDLCIVPGLAFDNRGHRIGYGKGFYDGLLSKVAAPKVALAYDFQVVEEVPKEDHDIPVNSIITPSEIIECKS